MVMLVRYLIGSIALIERPNVYPQFFGDVLILEGWSSRVALEGVQEETGWVRAIQGID